MSSINQHFWPKIGNLDWLVQKTPTEKPVTLCAAYITFCNFHEKFSWVNVFTPLILGLNCLLILVFHLYDWSLTLHPQERGAQIIKFFLIYINKTFQIFEQKCYFIFYHFKLSKFRAIGYQCDVSEFGNNDISLIQPS